MAGKVHVLLLESERGAADQAAADLRAAGHEVLRCHEPGAPAFPCGALLDEPNCPVRKHTVDVALTVRSLPRSQPAPREVGVSCALERHIPLVVAGSTVLNPFDQWATEISDGYEGYVAACERAAAAPLRRHGERAQQAADEVLALHGGTDKHVDVVVHRVEGRLVATVLGGRDLDHRTKSMISVRVISSLRAFDADAGGIDVAFE